MLLIDECISRHFKFKAKSRQKAVRTVRVLGSGTHDSLIEQYAERYNAKIVTADRDLAVCQVMRRKRSVFFVTMSTGDLYHIDVKKIGKVTSRLEPITHHITRSGPDQKIILP
ncbi:MAG: DUF5615 family PIN-like protein [Thaumarchaeota archaeon]|nr:DUF5615 family PIN-like protein [Nitrososphaerota archaeon]